MTRSWSGARCGGAPTAMLLARKGYRVLLVDRATFPSDTVSTHFVHAPGVAALERWGLRDALAGIGLPAGPDVQLRLRAVHDRGSPRPIDGVDVAYCPRRTVLDTMLVHAAADAGVEVREAFSVDEVLIEDGTVVGMRGKEAGGATVTEHAKVVIGADGRNSVGGQGGAARAVQREARGGPGVLLVLERCRQLGVRGLHQRSLRHGRLPDPRRPHARHRGPARGGLQRRPAATSRAPSCEPLDQAPAARRPGAIGNAGGTFPRRDRPRAATSASPTAPAGRSSATPATTCTRSPPRASPTRSWTPNGSPTPSTPRSPDADTFDDAMAGYQTARDEHVMPMYEMTFEFAQSISHRRPRCSSSWARWPATSKPWTTSSASRRARCRSRSSSAPTTSAASWPHNKVHRPSCLSARGRTTTWVRVTTGRRRD